MFPARFPFPSFTFRGLVRKLSLSSSESALPSHRLRQPGSACCHVVKRETSVRDMFTTSSLDDDKKSCQRTSRLEECATTQNRLYAMSAVCQDRP